MNVPGYGEARYQHPETQGEVDEIIERIKAAGDNADPAFRSSQLIGALSVILYRVDSRIADAFWDVAFLD